MDDLNSEILWLLDAETKLPASTEPVFLELEAGRLDIRVYKPRNPSDFRKRNREEDGINLVWLHFDLEKAGRYQLVLSIGSDYNIKATLRGGGGWHQICSTSRKA